jgi:SulP family sulfate permease
VRLLVCGLNHQPLDMARRCGFMAAIGPEHTYPDLNAGVTAALQYAT